MRRSLAAWGSSAWQEVQPRQSLLGAFDDIVKGKEGVNGLAGTRCQGAPGLFHTVEEKWGHSGTSDLVLFGVTHLPLQEATMAFSGQGPTQSCPGLPGLLGFRVSVAHGGEKERRAWMWGERAQGLGRSLLL